MDKLNELINIYLNIEENFIKLFLNEKNLSAPKSNFAWSIIDIPQKGNLRNGTEYFKHGFGIDFKNKEWKISMDFGDKGEWDGFDAWRLFLFAQDNPLELKFKSEDEIEALLIQGEKSGIFVKRGDLVYKKLSTKNS
jgi:hypothetical protein